jgi:dTMP kinase
MNRDDDSFLVTVESLDGAGGTTVCEELHFEYDCFLTQEPSDLWTGRTAKYCLDEDSDTHPLSDLYFFLGDRVHHIEKKVAPALDDYQMVVSDRWSDSTRAYQPVLLQDEFSSINEARDYVRECLRPIAYTPDLTLWIDTEPEECIDRIDDADKHEQLETLEMVRDEYKRLERSHSRIKQVDGNRPKRELVDACCSIINIYLDS